MAYSGATHAVISPATVIHGVPIIRYATPAATDNPGTWEYWNTASTVTKYVSPTNDLTKPFLLEFKPRGSAASARKDVDDNYATTDSVPVILGGRNGPLTVVGKNVNPGADIQTGRAWEAGGTAGSLTAQAWRSHAGLTGDGILNAPTLVYNAHTLANTHVFGTFLMY